MMQEKREDIDLSQEITNENPELSIAEDTLRIISRVDTGLGFFDTKSLFSLSPTSRSLHTTVSSEIKARAVQLVQYVVLGEEEKAKALVSESRALLYYKVEVKDYSGRTIIGTAWQAALGAEDIRMCEMLLPYFNTLEEGEALRQFNEQFPDGLEALDQFNAEHAYDFSDIVNAIITNKDVDEVMERFRKDMTEKNRIEQGKHFNMYHLIAAYQAYFNHFKALGTRPNRDKFWINVIGFIQRQMPTNYAQTFCSGLKLVEENPGKFRRTLDLNNGGYFFHSGLGFDFAVYSYYYGWCFRPPALCTHLGGDEVPHDAIRSVCKTKSNDLTELRDDLEQETCYQSQM